MIQLPGFLGGIAEVLVGVIPCKGTNALGDSQLDTPSMIITPPKVRIKIGIRLLFIKNHLRFPSLKTISYPIKQDSEVTRLLNPVHSEIRFVRQQVFITEFPAGVDPMRRAGHLPGS